MKDTFIMKHKGEEIWISIKKKTFYVPGSKKYSQYSGLSDMLNCIDRNEDVGRSMIVIQSDSIAIQVVKIKEKLYNGFICATPDGHEYKYTVDRYTLIVVQDNETVSGVKKAIGLAGLNDAKAALDLESKINKQIAKLEEVGYKHLADFSNAIGRMRKALPIVKS